MNNAENKTLKIEIELTEKEIQALFNKEASLIKTEKENDQTYFISSLIIEAHKHKKAYNKIINELAQMGIRM